MRRRAESLVRALRSPTGALIAVLFATGALFAPSLANGFAMDDRLAAKSVLDNGVPNRLIAEVRPLGDYFGNHYWAALHPERGDLYRPATVASFALARALFVPDGASETREARPQHALNLALHLLAVALVYLLVRRWVASAAPALLAACVFGLHAIHSEVVASVVGRSELLAFVCGAGALLVLTGDGARTPARRLTRAALGAGLFFLAFCSKESALAWAPFLGVWMAVQRHGLGARSAVPRDWMPGLCAALVALALYSCLRAGALQELAGPLPVQYVVNPLGHLEPPARVLNGVRIWGLGLLLTLFPFRLAADYGHATFALIETPWNMGFAAALLALAGTLAIGLGARRRASLVFLAAAAFLGFSFLTSNVPLAIGTVFGERLYYAPSLGLSFLAAWLVERVAPRPHLWVPTTALASLWLGGSALVAWNRNGVWRDDAALFLNEARVQPDSVRLRLCAATVHGQRGEREAAIAELKAAVDIDPQYALAWNNLAALYLDLGLLNDAEYCVERGLLAEHVDPVLDGFKLHCNQGLVLARSGRPREALGAFERSLSLEPTFQRSRAALLDQLWALGEKERYLEVLAAGEALDPLHPTWPTFRERLDTAAHGRSLP